MKKKLTHFATVAALAFTLAACGRSGEEHARHDDTGHTHGDGEGRHTHEKKTPGPNGGRLITSVTPRLEFFVTDDRKVRITAVDADAQPIAIDTQTVSLVGGDRTSPTELDFEKQGDALVSTAALPEGGDFPVIVTIVPDAGANPTLERFNVNFSSCPSCDYQEYACICAH